MSAIALTIDPEPFFAGLRAMFREYGNHETREEEQSDIAAQFDRTCADMCETWKQVRAAAISQKAAAPSEEWLPIATAPKDGSVLWTFNGEQGRMHWTEGEINGEKWALWVWDDQLLADVDSEPDQPTHWKPLPAPPIATPQAPEGGGL